MDFECENCEWEPETCGFAYLPIQNNEITISENVARCLFILGIHFGSSRKNEIDENDITSLVEDCKASGIELTKEDFESALQILQKLGVGKFE
jgi:hypothetical protein